MENPTSDTVFAGGVRSTDPVRTNARMKAAIERSDREMNERKTRATRRGFFAWIRRAVQRNHDSNSRQ